MKKTTTLLSFALPLAIATPCYSQTFASYTFDSLSTGMTSPGAYVLSLAMKDSTNTSDVYAGGHFKIAGRISAINIAEWHDTVPFSPNIGKWEALGAGVDSDVCALAIFNKKLYAGGKFDTAGGVASSHIARWDTANHTWDSLIGKLNGNVYALCVYNNQLYVGGDFTTANGDTVNRIAMWNDSAWSAVGKGFDSGTVYALAVSNDTLFAGGSFLKSNGRVVNHIARLNGSVWDSLKGGTNNTVYALADYEGWELFAGGAFTKSDTIATNYISYFLHYYHSWNAMGVGVNDTVRALNAGEGLAGTEPNKKRPSSGGNILLIGGNFDSAGGYGSHFIAGWMGGWDTVGELNGPVYALVNPYFSYLGDNYVGGRFSYANNFYLRSGDTVNNIAYLNVFLGGGVPTINNFNLVNVFPNPSSGKFTMQFVGTQNFVSEIEVYNEMGERVYYSTLPLNPHTGTFPIGIHSESEIDLRGQPDGVYFYRAIGEKEELIGDGKVMIQR